ncbi:integrin-linked protein kinase-like [Impatiens glandulifera]|uniref:integrin-linked protein kinase-like n=1 Tax=Impatiens glandulifera TaxID=253017 RepID=UPI001FB1412A|nr:integrin-linked protein kinase-like [Impatiens glandulifera]
MDNNSSSDDENSSSTDESSISTIDDSSSSDDDSISLDDVNKLMAEFESEVHPHFREIAAAIRNDDEFGLSVALDNFSGNIDQPLINGDTALNYACKRYSKLCFKLLLRRGCNIEAKTTSGEIPLHMACGSGLYKIVQIIFDYTADRDIINRMLQSVNMFGETIPWELAKPNSGIRRVLEESD